MGVHGLWELLAPVGRRVSVETLAGKKLAIDASIWLVQFMKAMRDEKGEMVRNAHLLGFFRRICKLLYLRTKPVFVFDGGTPALKRRTLVARRRQRDNAQAKVRKTAEKLLLNHLKAMKLREVAKDLEKQKRKPKHDVSIETKILLDRPKRIESNSEGNDVARRSCNQEKLDEMLAASILAEENGILSNDPSVSADATMLEDNGDEDDKEEIILPEMRGEVDLDVFAALPPSMQHELVQKYKNDAKGKKILSDTINVMGNDSERSKMISKSPRQESIDKMLAASIMAEEEGSLTNNASTSAAEYQDSEDQDDEDEEMIMPEMHGEVDPAVLTALPPSMQLDLLVQMRERLMAENRQKYQKVKKDPAKFSELQIHAYLKTVAFRRDIDDVQKAAAGRGVGGVQTSRIASEANREFIFSTSFTGDKQALTSTRVEKNVDKQQQAPGVQPSLNNESTNKSNAMTTSTSDESTRVFDDNIETYLDERGRVCVSRVRAMGMRMTRDLQRNLDLMKEFENEKTNGNKFAHLESMQTTDIGVPEISPSENHFAGISHEGTSKYENLNKENGHMLNSGTSIEISFEDKDEKSFDGVDDLFAHLVSENPLKISSFLNAPLEKQSSDISADSDWEEGLVEGKSNDSRSDFIVGTGPSLKEGYVSDDVEVEWEEGVIDIRNAKSGLVESGISISKGSLEEEADLQEAIRRSLEDRGDIESYHVMTENNKVKGGVEKGCEGTGVLNVSENMDGLEKTDDADRINCSQIISFPGRKVATEGEYCRELPCSAPASSLENMDVLMAAEKHLDTLKEINEPSMPMVPDECSKGNFNTPDASFHRSADSIWFEDGKNDSEAELPCHLVEMSKHDSLQVESFPKELTNGTDVEQKLTAEESPCEILSEDHTAEKPVIEDSDNAKVEVMAAEVEEEILFLDRERLKLGIDQRKLERNAESVSSEMFVECQELLQMFGLPYIIAPMEAEAQCAYLELANLVDGVVTDDSDVFLFGARSVYKNIFDDRKYVETYFMKDIENELGLTREKIIRMALLLGSDYTEGVSGIGIVNAIEVLNAFPEEDGLQKFREWIESPDPGILGKLDARTGSSARKRGSKAGENGEDCASEQNGSQAPKNNQSIDVPDVKQFFMDKHRNVSKNWHIPSSFPSEAVIFAYSDPQVDKSTENFSWGKPDHFVLRKLCWEKFGWDSQKADELLLPVLKEYSKHETQLRLEAFYTFNERFAKIRSKRIKKAVKGIAGDPSSAVFNDIVQDVPKTRRKRRADPVESMDKAPDKSSEGKERDETLIESDYAENNGHKQSRRKRLSEKTAQPAVKDIKLPMQTESKQIRSRISQESRRARGRSKGRGRGRGRGAGRGKGEGASGIDITETSNSDGDNDNDEQEFNLEMLQEPQDMRRSTRLRKPVSYVGHDDVDEPLDQAEVNFSDKAMECDSPINQLASRDAIAGISKQKEHNLENPSDHLKSGEFCTIETDDLPFEDDVSQPSGLKEDDLPFETDFGEDYIKMGGGFCEEESNTCNNQDGNHCVVIDVVSENPDIPGCSGFTDEGDNERSNNSSFDIDEKRQENTKDDVETTTIGALSAMPNLRRKRRKW